ncbi:MAG TPA: DUF2071 domain-containing protein [Gaiellaceae bacterium]|nr:DUF2071 domain-containing protein [Gaiellaceae bacterium]
MPPDAIAEPFRQTATLRHRSHRPWPLPRRPWLLGQTWRSLLFAHWPLDPAVLAPLVPRPLALDTFAGRAWIGLTPFVVTGHRPAPLPPLPVVSTFPELNVRTYVTAGGKPGIHFFSLDAASSLAVAAARWYYHLPYYRAEMSTVRADGAVAYESTRVDDRGGQARFVARYGATGAPVQAEHGSLEHFLVERYCLYTLAEGRLLRGEIHHPPWPLQPAEAEIAVNTMAPAGVELPGTPPLLHFAARQDVLIWGPARVRRDA